MRVLVTGAAGFVGRHLLSALRTAGHEPLSTDSQADPAAGIAALDIGDAGTVDAAIQRLQPGACIHLAGIAFVPDAARAPLALDAINVAGTLHVARALLRHVPRQRSAIMAGGGTAFEGPGRAAPAGFRAPVTGVAGGCPGTGRQQRPGLPGPSPETPPDRPPGLATGAGFRGRKGGNW